MKWKLLLFLPVAAAACFKQPGDAKLDLAAPCDNPNVDSHEDEFDGVFYTHFKPAAGARIAAVWDGNAELWRAQDGSWSCTYALAAKKDTKPFLLYLRTASGEAEADEFFKRELGTWKKISNQDYNIHLERLKDFVRAKLVTLFLEGGENSEYYRSYALAGEAECKVMTMNRGYTAWRVFYRTALWEAQAPEERCVAAWAYRLGGANTDFVKLLVTRKNNTSELVNLCYTRDKWGRCDPAKKYPDAAFLRSPQNFLHPEYEFTDRKCEVHFPPRPVAPENRGAALRNEEPDVVYLDAGVVNEYARRFKEELDDVVYYHYYPLNDETVTRLQLAGATVWRALLDERLKYALAVHDARGPVALYLLLRLRGAVASLYLARTKKGWERSNWLAYTRRVDALKRATKVFADVNLNLFNVFDPTKFDLTLGRNYLLHLPRRGKMLRSVSYMSQTIWKQSGSEKCVAVWAFGHGFYVALRLLVTENGTPGVRSFYRVDGNFVRVLGAVKQHDGPEPRHFLYLRDSKLEVPAEHYAMVAELPADFLYPDYPFTPRFRALSYTDPVEQYEDLYSSAVVRDAAHADYLSKFRPFPHSSCELVALEVTKVDAATAEVDAAVFDGRLTVFFMSPRPGKCFGAISEKRAKLFGTDRVKYPAAGVFLYVKDGAYVLADVLLHGAKPASLYLQKVKGVWSTVSAEAFHKLLEDLRRL